MAQEAGYPLYVVKPYDENEIKSIADPYTKLAARMSAQKQAYTLKQQALRNSEAKAVYESESELNKVVKIGGATYETNAQDLFRKVISDGIDIQNGIATGNIDPSTGARALVSLNATFDSYKRNAPNVLAMAKYAESVGAGGFDTSSKLNDPNLGILLKKLQNSSSEVSLAQVEGTLILKGKGTIIDSFGKEIPWEYDLNIDEFEKQFANGGTQIIKTVPTKEELGLEGIAKPLMAAMNAQGNYKQIKEKNGQTSTSEYFNIDEMKAALVGQNSTAVDSIIRGGDADIIWADMFMKGHNIDYLKDNNLLWDPASSVEHTIESTTGVEYKGNMLNIMKQYLADEIIAMIPPSQQVMFEKDQDGNPNPYGDIIPHDSNYTWNENLKENEKEEDLTDAQKTFDIYSRDPLFEMENALIDSGKNPGATVSEKSGVYTITFPETDIRKATKVDYNMYEKNDFIRFYRSIRNLNDRFEGTSDKAGQSKEEFDKIVNEGWLKFEKEFKSSGTDPVQMPHKQRVTEMLKNITKDGYYGVLSKAEEKTLRNFAKNEFSSKKDNVYEGQEQWDIELEIALQRRLDFLRSDVTEQSK
tara:strand:+ start:1477 stop:3234 length:1758 start_codon:yes stop_codon:yes gene_type:complete